MANEQFPNRSKADGLWNFKDIHRGSKNAYWPTVPKITSITPDANTILESSSNAISVTGEGHVNNTTYYWSVVHGTTTADNFVADSGSFTVSSADNTGSFDVDTTLTGDFARGDLTFTLVIKQVSQSGPIAYTSGTYTIPVTSLTYNSLLSSYTENQIVSLQIGIAPTGTRQQTFTFTSSNPDDLNLSGSDLVTTTINSTQSNNVSIVLDFLTEGTESVTLTANNTEAGGALGTVSFDITDLSTTITNSTFASTAGFTHDEGDDVVFTFTDDDNASNTGGITWTVNNGTTTNADFEYVTGNVSMSNGEATITIPTVVDSDVSESAETFTVTLTSTATGATLGTSPTITLNNTVPNITTEFIEISNRNIVPPSTSDYTGAYDVSNSLVPVSFSGSARVMLAIKVTAPTTFYNDVCIAGVQILSSGGTVLQTWNFYTTSTPWGTTGVQYAGPAVGIYESPATAVAYPYYTISTSTNTARMSLATGTGSSNTGAADGIGNVTTAYPVGDGQISQSASTYFMFRETSGSNANSVVFGRSPAYTFSGGEQIRVAHLLTSPSGNEMDDTDTLWLAVG